MSNSYFNFVEAPDFATALRQGFSAFNESADRAEQLERENDKIREKNAGVPLEIVKGLIEFAPTLKKISDSLDEKTFDSNVAKGYKDADTTGVEDGLKNVFDTEKKGQFLKKAALDDKDNDAYGVFAVDFTSARDRDNLIFDVKQGLPASLNTHLTKYYPDKFNSTAEYRAAYQEWETEVISNLKKQGFKERYIKHRLEDKFEELENSFLTKQANDLAVKNTAIEQNRIVGEVVRSLNSDDPIKAFNDTVAFNAAFYDGNIARGYRASINIAMKAVEKGVLPIDKLESVLFQEVTAKGDKRRLLIDKLGGGAESEVWAQGVIENLEKLRKESFDKIQEEKTTYAKGFVQEVDKIEADTGRMTKLEYANYVKTNWDIGRGGGNLPEAVKNRLSKEDADDFLQRAYLDDKISKNLPITKEEVLKLNDPFVEAQYLPKVSEKGNELAPTQDLIAQAKVQIGGYATKHAKQEGVAPGRESNQWINITQNAEREYPLLYAKYIGDADSPLDAHIEALKEIERKTIAGVYDNLVVNTDANKTRSLNLIKAEEHIKTVDSNIINTGIIFGTEDVVAEAANYPTGTTHLFYSQLAAKIPGVNGAQLQYKQVEIYNKLNGAEAPVKSDLLLEYEKLDPKVQFYLSHHPSPAKVARAKIEAFKDDAKIDYDEIEFLMPEAAKALTQTIKEDPSAFRRNLDIPVTDLSPEMQEAALGVTPQLGKLEPRRGDWQRTEQGTFIVWDGKQWKERGVFATGNKEPFVGEINEYLDRDKVRRKF